MFTLALVLLSVAGIMGNPYPFYRIIGGKPATQGQIPGIVSLRSRGSNSHFCGGAIIAPDVILTAAHCLVGNSASNIQAVAGSIKLSSGGTTVTAKSITWHQNFNSNTLKDDVGLIRLSSSLSYNSNIQPLKLADDSTVGTGDVVTACGWGTISYPNTQVPDNLQWVNGQVRDSSECSRALGDNIGAGQICFGGVNGQGLCFGDSGSPLVSSSGDTTVGIVSWGEPCGIGYPDVFTRVSNYRTWINNQVLAWKNEEIITA